MISILRNMHIKFFKKQNDGWETYPEVPAQKAEIEGELSGSIGEVRPKTLRTR